MMIIGVDYHPSFQAIAFFEEETGECGEQELNHSVVDRNDGTTVSPRPPILMCLYSVNLGLAMKFLRFA